MFEFYIATPVLNAVETIDHTIWSVVSQEGALHIHYHVQDAGSTDGTLQKIQLWSERLRHPGILPAKVSFSFASEPDSGLYDGVAKGFAHLDIPDTAFMSWLNADDILWQGALAAIGEVARDIPDIDWILGQPTNIDLWGRVRSNRGTPLATTVIAAGLAGEPYSVFQQQESTVWRKHLYDKAGGLNTSLKLAGDWDLWRRFAQHSELANLNRNIGAFRFRMGQLSSNMERYAAEMNAIVPLAEREQAFRTLLAKGELLRLNIIDVQEDGRWALFERTMRPKPWFFNMPGDDAVLGALETRIGTVAHHLDDVAASLTEQVRILHEDFSTFRTNIKHPLRYFFRKCFGK